ncbi:MAG: response regulator, partial [Campylobacterota bacterium]
QSFSQIDESMTRKYGGTGLGLSICKELVQLMGGEIYFESVRGTGTTFYVELSLQKASMEQLPALDAVQTVDKKRSVYPYFKVLLVEDNESNREIIQTLLQSYNISIDVAFNGKEGVVMFAKDRYDLVLMDLQMPVMDGYEAAKKIRQSGSETPIIALSANVVESEIQRAKECGMDEHLTKPVKVEKLYETILKYCEKCLKVAKIAPIQLHGLILSDNCIDTKKGLANMNGNQKLYQKVLNNFYETYKDIEFEKYRSDALTRVIHTLKGLSANIGAQRLYALLKEQEREPSMDFTQLDEELEKVISRIQQMQVMQKDNESTLASISKEDEDILFKELQEAILSKRPSRCDVSIQKLEKYRLSEEKMQQFTQIQDAVKKFDYKRALKLFDDL